MTTLRTPLLALGFCLLASVQVAQACTQDHFTLARGELQVTLCDGGHVQEADGIAQVHLNSTLRYGGHTLVEDHLLTLPAGSNTPRVIDDIDLSPLGLEGRLHITIRLGAGGPTIVHALSLPGPTILR